MNAGRLSIALRNASPILLTSIANGGWDAMLWGPYLDEGVFRQSSGPTPCFATKQQ